jgi:hypothetical protein
VREHISTRRSPERAIDQPDRTSAGGFNDNLRPLGTVHRNELAICNQQPHTLDVLHRDASLCRIGADPRKLFVAHAERSADKAISGFYGEYEGVGDILPIGTAKYKRLGCCRILNSLSADTKSAAGMLGGADFTVTAAPVDVGIALEFPKWLSPGRRA